MNNFTPRAQQVLAHARREADRFNHHYIGTEHLLLGLLKLGKGVAVTILENLGVELNAVRQQVEQQIGRGTEPQAEGNIPYTPRVRKVLALANREAQELNHTYVGTEHLLLGLIRDGDGVARTDSAPFRRGSGTGPPGTAGRAHAQIPNGCG